MWTGPYRILVKISAHESLSNVSKELSPYLIIVTMPELRGWALTSLEAKGLTRSKLKWPSFSKMQNSVIQARFRTA